MQVRYQLRHSPNKLFSTMPQPAEFVSPGPKQLLYFSTEITECKIELQRWNSGRLRHVALRGSALQRTRGQGIQAYIVLGQVPPDTAGCCVAFLQDRPVGI